jgi:hypothetical protein
VRRYIVVYLSFSRRIQFAYILSVRRVPAVRTSPSLFKIKILLRSFLTDLNWTLVEYLFSIFFLVRRVSWCAVAEINPNVHLCGYTNIGTKARVNHRGNDRRRDFAALARRRRWCRGPAVALSSLRFRDEDNDDYYSVAGGTFPAGPGDDVTCVRQL